MAAAFPKIEAKENSGAGVERTGLTLLPPAPRLKSWDNRSIEFSVVVTREGGGLGVVGGGMFGFPKVWRKVGAVLGGILWKGFN